MTTGKRTAFIGLGVMGYPMAGHLSQAGHEVVVFNRNSERSKAWASEYEGQIAGTPGQAAEEADVVFVCVGNDDDVRSVVYGDDGIFAGLKPNSVLVDHTTASSELAEELADAATQQGCGFVDAPVSGGQAGAENGQLTVMCGGLENTFSAVAPVIEAYAKSVKLLGAVGAGQLTKMVNQICIAGIVQGLSEALHFAKCAGLDGDAVVEVISKGAAQSWQMENRSTSMNAGEFEFGFAVDWMRKDLDITLRTARKLSAQLPMTALVDQFYADVQNAGGGRWDTSSLITRLKSQD